jgi:hypothetical protein
MNPRGEVVRIPVVQKVLFYLLSTIAILAVIRRMVALISYRPGMPQARPNDLDGFFAKHDVITWFHIVPAVCFVIFAIFWFSTRLRRSRPTLHHRLTIAMLTLGTATGITALMMSAFPIGGRIEIAATVTFAVLFLFSLGRAWRAMGRDERLHREWMVRATAVLLGIATTRPVVGVFFATSKLTGMQPSQFFGIAFWIGFTVTWISGELWLRSKTGRRYCALR